MALFQVFIFIVFSFLLLFLQLQPSTSAEICRAFCGDQWIRFPFRLSSQLERCGYPRFNLSCKSQTEAILTLPYSGEFVVENIDYLEQSIWINDPDHCPPRRLLQGVDFSGTPFVPLYHENYVFLNCTLGAIKSLPVYISCLSGEGFSVVAIPENRLYMYGTLSPPACFNIANVSIPASDPNYGIQLKWNEPNCKSCELSERSCNFRSDTGLNIECSGGSRAGLPRSAKYGLIFGVGVPFLSVLGLVFSLRRNLNNYNNHHHQQRNPEISIPVVPRRLADDSNGLDAPTIESYPITLLGESRRLPRPGDNTCPICLCEYQAKEKLRSIPDCKHYFHAICIDEWLKVNAACPICRQTPGRSAPAVSSS